MSFEGKPEIRIAGELPPHASVRGVGFECGAFWCRIGREDALQGLGRGYAGECEFRVVGGGLPGLCSPGECVGGPYPHRDFVGRGIVLARRAAHSPSARRGGPCKAICGSCWPCGQLAVSGFLPLRKQAFDGQKTKNSRLLLQPAALYSFAVRGGFEPPVR